MACTSATTKWGTLVSNDAPNIGVGRLGSRTRRVATLRRTHSSEGLAKAMLRSDLRWVLTLLRALTVLLVQTLLLVRTLSRIQRRHRSPHLLRGRKLNRGWSLGMRHLRRMRTSLHLNRVRVG